MIDDPSTNTLSFRHAFTEKRAIYHQAFPNYFDCLDITKLNGETDDLAYKLIEAILKQKPFHQELKADFNANQSFYHFFFEARNAGKTTGVNPVSLGFPLLMARIEEELVVAPLFLWPLFPEPASTSSDHWLLEYRPVYEPQFNPFLHSWMVAIAGADFAEKLPIPTHPGAEELTDFCNKLSELLGIEATSAYPALSPFPEASEIDCLAEKGEIVWSGLLGDFPMAGPVYPALAENSPEAVLPWGHRLGLLPLDPWQSSVARYFERNQTTLVGGSAGTGKSHLLTYLISNALSNGKTTLVVAPSLGALRQIQENLFSLGLGAYCFLLQDEVSDRVVLLELLRGKQKSQKKNILPSDKFRALEDRLSREQQKLDECYAALNRDVFDDENWTQTVGLYLEANQKEGKELLHGQLNPSDFKYQLSELNTITKGIESCGELFNNLNALNHPLQSLNSGIFIHNNEEDGLSFIETQLSSFLEKSSQLQHQYLLARNEYTERLMDHYGEYYRDVREQLEEVQDKIRDSQNLHESDVLNSGKKTLQFYGLFAGKFRDALAAKDDVAKAYQELIRRFKKSNYFEFSFATDNQRLEQMDVKLEGFSVELDRWWTGLPDHLQEEMMRLSYKTVLPELNFEDRVRTLELNLDLLVEELNGSGLYQLPLERKMLTIPRRQKFLEEIIEKLEETRFHLRDYPTFYQWQHNWFSLSETTRRVVRALTKIRPNDWLTAFRSWYFNQALSNAYDPMLPIRDLPLNTLVKTHQKLEKLLLPAIEKHWENQREKALKGLTKGQKKRLEAMFDKRQSAEDFKLEEILQSEGSLLTSLLPVVLTTPKYASKYFQGKKPVFDAVLIDEGHLLSSQQGQEILKKASRQLACYDHNLVLPKSAGFVSNLQRNGVFSLPLKTLHRAGPGNWWQTAGQVPGSLNFPEDLSLQLEQINGRFEGTTGTNEEEVQAILQFLNRIEKTPQRTYPSVGIVCFTIEQRNLLSEYLLRIKRQRLTGVEMIQQLERNGLGVFHLSELNGLHFDILIVSVTYGQTDISGKISQQLSAFNTYPGLVNLQLLLGRSMKQLFIMNSLPLEFLEEVAESKEKSGLQLLAQFLIYATLNSQNKTDQYRIGLDRLKQHWGTLAPENSGHFSQEVINRLQESGFKGPFQVNLLQGNLKLPIVFTPYLKNEHTPVVLVPDGFFSKASGTDFLWEHQQREQLQQSGYQIINLWSVLWWKNPNQALYQLLQEIAGVSSEEEE